MHCGRVQVRPERDKNTTLHKGRIRSHGVRENIRARIAGERIGETGGRKDDRSTEGWGTRAVYEDLTIIKFICQSIGDANGKPSSSRWVPRHPHTGGEQVPLTIHTREAGETG